MTDSDHQLSDQSAVADRVLAELGPGATSLRELKGRLKELLGTSLVGFRLFGSRARGDWHESSDVDVAIIVRGMDRATRAQVLQVVAEIEVEHLTPLSALVLSEERFAELLRRERRIATDIRTEGIPL